MLQIPVFFNTGRELFQAGCFPVKCSFALLEIQTQGLHLMHDCQKEENQPVCSLNAA